MENVKIENLLCDILGDFQTLWVQQKVTYKVTIILFAPCKQTFTTLLASLTFIKRHKIRSKVWGFLRVDILWTCYNCCSTLQTFFAGSRKMLLVPRRINKRDAIYSPNVTKNI